VSDATSDDRGRPTALDKSPEALEADIARTREALAEDVERLAQQLSPDHLKGQLQEQLQGVQEAVLEATHEVTDEVAKRAGEVGSRLVEVVRNHPFPVTLGVLGVALLAIGGGAATRRALNDDSGAQDQTVYAGRSGVRSYDAYGAYDSGYDTYGGGDDRREGRSFSEPAGAYGGRAEHETRSAGRGLAGFVEERPLVAGAATLLLGVLVGLALPSPRQEEAFLGDARSDLTEEVRGTARRAKVAVQTALEEAKESAKQELSSQEGAEQNGESPTGNVRVVTQRTAESPPEDEGR